MKTSKYNFFVEKNNQYYLFNQLSGALTQVDNDLFYSLKEGNLVNLDDDLKNELSESHFVCDDDLVEENILLCVNRELRYAKDIARITILPTINCNFSCWYCYESHTDSRMTDDDMEAVFLFCEKIIQNNRLKVFHLDWFGGEPFLYFNELMYPLALRLKKMCSDNNIFFNHTVTTNGYLINGEIINKINEIGLNTFQITLDGDEFYHNKTRFSYDDKQTYKAIVNNIVLLCRQVPNIQMDVRINYTPKNIGTIDKIALSFPNDIRDRIAIHPQQVWQFKDDVNTVDDVIKEKMDVFTKVGYQTQRVMLPHLNCGCYVENSLQYVVNYDLSVYKCTARDFISKKHSIGAISRDGTFQANSNYYNYFVSSFMENEECLACAFLPSCFGMCIQKKIEGSIPTCPKQKIETSLFNCLNVIIDNQDKL